jgi:PAS domain S-box-containing protein
VLCAAVVAGLTIAEYHTSRALPFNLLLLIPLMVAAIFLSLPIMLLFAVGTALAHELFSPYAGDGSAWLRLPITMLCYTTIAFLVVELKQRRETIGELAAETEHQRELQADAERDARAVIETTPAAILTVNSEGKITMANRLAARLLGFMEGTPEGQAINNYIPVLAKILTNTEGGARNRTVLEAYGRRQNGETLVAQTWISLHKTSSGPKLTVMLADALDDFVDSEEQGLRELLTSSRVIAGAVSHEIRNLAAAASILYSNVENGVTNGSPNSFETLGRVIESISNISSGQLRRDSEREALEGLSVADVLRELETIIKPTFAAAGAGLEWEIDEGLPNARASHSSLLQVFINLAQNSCRAVTDIPRGRLRVTAFQLTNLVVIRFSDNGPGMRSLERLFQPLQPGAASRGLGLFISRAIVQSFGGDLHHAQRPGECAFIIELPMIEGAENTDA